jgi:hypothetical protein
LPINERGGSRQRFNAAEVLFDADLTLDAQYVGGYVVECAFKALIIEATSVADRPAKLIRITRNASMHTPETHLLELRNDWLASELHQSRYRQFGFGYTFRIKYSIGHFPWIYPQYRVRQPKSVNAVTKAAGISSGSNRISTWVPSENRSFDCGTTTPLRTIEQCQSRYLLIHL